MSKGVLLFAFNNESINYIKQAIFCAERVKKYLDLPVSVVTDYKLSDSETKHFDKIISLDSNTNNKKAYRDGSLSKRVLSFNNFGRESSYDLSPYDETIVMDTDYIVANEKLLNCFIQQKDLLLYKDATHLGIHNGTPEFKSISDGGVDFYWATVIYFKKSPITKTFFDLVTHIQENWFHYKNLYRLTASTFRNDFAFSMAIHTMNGYRKGGFVGILPGKKYFTTDKDLCVSIDETKFKFLLQQKDNVDFFPAKTDGCNVHIMNKFSLNRMIDEL